MGCKLIDLDNVLATSISLLHYLIYIYIYIYILWLFQTVFFIYLQLKMIKLDCVVSKSKYCICYSKNVSSFVISFEKKKEILTKNKLSCDEKKY